MAATTPPSKRKNRQHRKVGRSSPPYAHWVGAGAVVIGMGAAMATGQGVALADDSASEGSIGETSNSASTTGPTNTGPPAPSNIGPVDPVTPNSEPGAPSPGSGDAPTSTVSAQTNTSAETAEEVEEEEDSTETDTTDTEAEAETETEGDDPESSEPTVEVISTTPPTPVQQPETATSNNSGNPSTVAPLDISPSPAPAGAAPSASAPASVAGHVAPAAVTGQQSAASTPLLTLNPNPPVQTTALVTQAVPVPTTTPVSVVTGLVSGLLAWVGGAPSLTSVPAAPVESPGSLGLLAWVRRQLFNQTPVTNYNPTQNSQSVDGVVTGNLNAVDADGDPLTFSVTQAPQHGTVVVNPNGTFAYTPNPDFADAGGTDSFTVTVSDDDGTHIHLLGLLQPGGGHSTQATVALTVTPVNDAPAVGNPPYSVITINPATGVVTGTVNVTDDDGDTLTYSLSGPPDPAKGTVVVDPTSGNWTYTPNLNARLKASDINATPAAQQVGFTITASDGQASTPVAVTSPVQALAITAINVGDVPMSVAVSPDSTHVYVTHVGGEDHTVGVIDTATNTVVATIPGGHGPVQVVVNPDGNHVYVAAIFDDAVLVIDTVTNTVTATIPVGDGPRALAVSPDGSRLYVTNLESNDVGPDTVSVIDTATNAVVATITVGHSPNGIAVSGTHAYVSNSTGDAVSVIDTTTNAVVATIPAGPGPREIAVSPDGSRVYVVTLSNTANPEGAVLVIDTATNTVVATIPDLASPDGVAVSPDGAHVYVVNSGNGTVVAIDAATNTVIATLQPGPGSATLLDVAVSPDGKRAYVTDVTDVVRVITLG